MTMASPPPDVLIVGAGPAGLAAAIELRRLGVPRVLVLEREAQAGGVPRHSVHTGFGLRDLHRVMSGPRYAARYVDLALAAGIELRTGATVTGWTRGSALSVTSAAGIEEIAPRAVVLATGCRERPRAARLVPGTRPEGVLTTGALQQLVYLRHQPIGQRAVVVGAEHVSFSAVLTLAHAGTHTAALVTEHARQQSYAPFRWLTTAPRRVPILTASRVTNILGLRRVEAVEVTALRDGAVRRIDCDTVVFTGDWIADHELARRGGLAMDAGTRAPRVDLALRTSQPGVFAAGNLLHGAETADVAALGGRHVARAVRDFLAGTAWPDRVLPIRCAAPLRWISPNAITAGAATPPLGRFTLRVGEVCPAVELIVRQDSRVLWQQPHRSLIPNRPIHLPAGWLAKAGLGGRAIEVGLRFR